MVRSILTAGGRVVAVRTLTTVTIATLLCGTATSAFADTCENYKTPTQVLNGLASDDAGAKLSAKTCGLASSDPAVRGVVMQQLLVGVTTMSFDLAAQPRDTEGAQLVDRFPSLVVGGVTWSKDGRNFDAQGIRDHVGHVQGQFLGQSLGVAFTQVRVDPAKAGQQPQDTSCSATLTLPPGGTGLTGLMRCEGFAPRLQLSLGI